MPKSIAASVVTLVALCAVVAAPARTAGAQGAKAAVVWPAGDIKWADNAAIKGAKIAVLWGDPKTGAYGALKSLPDGSTLALHTHTQDQRVIVLSGTLTVSIDGAPAKETGPGAFAFIPGGVKHVANCKKGAECRYFEEQPGASDIKFVGGAAK